MLTATKVFEFEAAHRLLNYKGVCNQLHGHRYQLEVSVKSIAQRLDPQEMIMDFAALKLITQANVINKLDHSYLNEVLGCDQPTAEVIIEWIAKAIKPFLPLGIKLCELKLYETSNSYITWRP